MNHLLYNISIIIIIIGIILLTNSLSINASPYYKQNCNITRKYRTNITHDYPSKVFNKMFDSPSVWMGYTDTESNEVVLSE